MNRNIFNKHDLSSFSVIFDIYEMCFCYFRNVKNVPNVGNSGRFDICVLKILQVYIQFQTLSKCQNFKIPITVLESILFMFRDGHESVELLSTNSDKDRVSTECN